MLFIAAAELVVAGVSFGDEVEEIGLGGSHGGFQGFAPGIGDGAGRQSGKLIGVVRGCCLEIALVDSAAITSVDESGINDGRICGECDVTAKTVVINTRDNGS